MFDVDVVWSKGIVVSGVNDCLGCLFIGDFYVSGFELFCVLVGGPVGFTCFVCDGFSEVFVESVCDVHVVV